jgi:hypothetical protein
MRIWSSSCGRLLLKMLEACPEVRKLAERDDIGWDDFLLRLLRPQYQARQEQAMKSCLKRRPPARALVAGEPPLRAAARGEPEANPRLRRARLHPQAMKIVFYGKTGVGKTGLATRKVMDSNTPPNRRTLLCKSLSLR